MNLIKVDINLINPVTLPRFWDMMAQKGFKMSENGDVWLPREDANYFVGLHSSYLKDNMEATTA